jgi:putative flippase GtrA
VTYIEAGERRGRRRWKALFTHSLPRFLVSGVASVVVDMGLLYLLHGVLGMWLPAAVFTSTASSFALNFGLNRMWSFGNVTTPAGGQMVRYLLLAGINWVLTVLMVSGLVWLGLFYLVAKAVTVLINSAINYFAYRFWVFAENPIGFRGKSS